MATETRIRKRVLGEITTALLQQGLTNLGEAQLLAQALADGKIPHVTVVF